MLVLTSAPVASNRIFFFIISPTTQMYTLSLHDALPIYIYIAQDTSLERLLRRRGRRRRSRLPVEGFAFHQFDTRDRKSTRLNSSHANISYAVFCLKKKIRSREARPADTPTASGVPGDAR